MAKRQVVAAPQPEPSTEVAVQENTIPGIQMITDEETLAELEGVIGVGVSENAKDKAVALLYTAQKGSPQLDKKQDGKYIEGLEFGDLFNNITGEYYKAESDGLEVLPCFYRVNYVRWKPDRGGFVSMEKRDTPLLKQAKPYVDPKKPDAKPRGDMFELPDGDILVETHHYFCVLPATFQTIIIAMSSTNLTASRKWQSLLDAQKIETAQGFFPKPGFWTRYRLNTVYRDDGDYQWYQMSASIIGPNEDKKLRAFCKAFALSVIADEVKISTPIAEGGGATGAGDSSIPV